MLRLGAWNAEPLLEIPYLYARKGGGVTVEGSLAITVCEVSGLPSDLNGLVLTADLQGRELLPESRRHRKSVSHEGPRLLGEVVAEALTQLSETGQLPTGDRLGVVLAGDFWAEPGCIRRGRMGDIRPVWEALGQGRRWVVGVRGNHDTFQSQSTDPLDGLILLEGSAVTLDEIHFGGVDGIIGNPKKPRKTTEKYFIETIERLMQEGIEILILHEGPSGDEPHLRGSSAVRKCLSHARDLLVVFGHCHWSEPMHSLNESAQLINVDSRVIVLVREGWQS